MIENILLALVTIKVIRTPGMIQRLVIVFDGDGDDLMLGISWLWKAIFRANLNINRADV